MNDNEHEEHSEQPQAEHDAEVVSKAITLEHVAEQQGTAELHPGIGVSELELVPHQADVPLVDPVVKRSPIRIKVSCDGVPDVVVEVEHETTDEIMAAWRAVMGVRSTEKQVTWARAGTVQDRSWATARGNQ